MFRKQLCLLAITLAGNASLAVAASVEEALKYTPIQRDVDFDRPSPEEQKLCTIKLEVLHGRTGFVVRGAAGQLLRCFADTNGDKKLDQWCYYHNGIESYRDLDTDFNEKVDQYRWLGLSGIRWGVDTNEDTQIDRWKAISAEEVTSEVVAALRERNADRFARLLLTVSELKELGLDDARTERILKSLQTAAQRFGQLTRSQQQVTRDTAWTHFGAARPGVMPQGTDGLSQDVVVYENVIAMVETKGKHGQLGIGTLVRIGDVWRLVDVPTDLLDEQSALAANGYFLQAIDATNAATPNAPANPLNERQQQLASQLEKIEADLAKSQSAREKAPLYGRLVATLRQLADGASDEKERDSWILQLADTLNSAVQTEEYPDGAKQLEQLYQEQLKATPRSNVTGHVKFAIMTINYARSLTQKEANYQEIQDKWLSQLEGFVNDFPTSVDATEAMLQLAIAEEFSGDDEKALQWYRQITAGDNKGLVAGKAAGAIRRLTSAGKPISLRGNTVALRNQSLVAGKALNTADLRGRLVLIHYWATWCEPCKQDITAIARLRAKYGSRGFVPVSVNLDADARLLATYLAKNPLKWQTMYERGGLDSPLAVQLGVLTVPTMILLDPQGKVVNRNLQIGELEGAIQATLGPVARRTSRQK